MKRMNRKNVVRAGVIMLVVMFLASTAKLLVTGSLLGISTLRLTASPSHYYVKNGQDVKLQLILSNFSFAQWEVWNGFSLATECYRPHSSWCSVSVRDDTGEVVARKNDGPSIGSGGTTPIEFGKPDVDIYEVTQDYDLKWNTTYTVVIAIHAEKEDSQDSTIVYSNPVKITFD